MSSQGLREGQRRQEYRAEITRGYQAALCNHGIPGWTLAEEVAKVADRLIAAYPKPTREQVLHAIGEELTSEGMVGYALDQKLTDAVMTLLIR